tara:strand:- start:20870 stop:21037 length:168 start_codon:yes stop_codon:yes gene_type:complete
MLFHCDIILDGVIKATGNNKRKIHHLGANNNGISIKDQNVDQGIILQRPTRKTLK